MENVFIKDHSGTNGPKRGDCVTSVLQSEVLTLTSVSHLQVFVSAHTGVSEYRCHGSDSTSVFPITAVEAD